MKKKHKKSIDRLAAQGWEVRFNLTPTPCPTELRTRYDWLPKDIVAFVEETERLLSPDNKVWFNTSSDLWNLSGAAFTWNQWERDSLTAADEYPKLQHEIAKFWDSHFPIVISVKENYAHFAIQKGDLIVVCGEEPEYEEVKPVADSFSDFIEKLATGSSELSPWI